MFACTGMLDDGLPFSGGHSIRKTIPRIPFQEGCIIIIEKRKRGPGDRGPRNGLKPAKQNENAHYSAALHFQFPAVAFEGYFLLCRHMFLTSTCSLISHWLPASSGTSRCKKSSCQRRIASKKISEIKQMPILLLQRTEKNDSICIKPHTVVHLIENDPIDLPLCPICDLKFGPHSIIRL